MGFTSNFRDGRLVSRTLAGDSAAFTELVHRHMPAVAAVALAYTKNPAEADDIVQEAFVKAWQALDTLRTHRRFGGWVVTIARNVARARHNQFRRESETLRQFGLEAAMHATHESSDGEDYLHRLLPGLLAELPESDRELVLLHYYGGKKTREVAELLTLSHDVVRKRLERIRQKLGQMMLASLEPDSEERARRDKRAMRIASAVIVLPVPWTRAAAGGIGAAAGIPSALKIALVAVLAVPVIYASYRSPQGGRPNSRAAASNAVGALQATTPHREGVSSVRPISKPVATTSDAALTASIEGRLLEQDTEKGVAGGAIDLQSVATNDVITAVTDDTGHYIFKSLYPGQYWISLHLDKPFVTRYPRNKYALQKRSITVLAGAVIVEADFAVTRGLPVRGQVVNSKGDPVSGAVVEGWSVPNTVEATTTTDAEGRFEFYGFGTDAPAYIWPRFPQMALPPRGPITVPPEGVDGLVLTMGTESAMSGRVTDQFGVALPGAEVTFWPEGAFSVPDDYTVTTDEEGGFAIAGLYSSRYLFDVKRSGETGGQRLNNIGAIALAVGERLHDVELVYEIPGALSISGRVTDDLGEPLRGILVSAERDTNYRWGETSDDGFYEIKDLASGVYNVIARVTSLSDPEWNQAEAEAGAAEVNFLIPRAVTACGRVVDAATGNPISAFDVMVQPAAFLWTGFRHDDGRFEITGIPLNELSIYARADGYATGSSSPVTLAPGERLEEIVVALKKAGSISIRVLGPDGGPVRDVSVGTDMALPGLDETARTDADGMLRIDHAQPGTQTISASHPDYAPSSVQVDVRAGELTETEIHLSKGATLRGVVSSNGEVLEDVHLTLEQRKAEGKVGYRVVINSSHDGAFDFKGIPTGNLLLGVNPEYGTQGRYIEIPLYFSGSEEKNMEISVDLGTASAKFDIELDAELIARDGRIWVDIEYVLEGGGRERVFTIAPVGSEIRLDGLRPGVATIRARYDARSEDDPLAETEPREIFLEDGMENRVAIDFASPY